MVIEKYRMSYREILTRSCCIQIHSYERFINIEKVLFMSIVTFLKGLCAMFRADDGGKRIMLFP